MQRNSRFIRCAGWVLFFLLALALRTIHCTCINFDETNTQYLQDYTQIYLIGLKFYTTGIVEILYLIFCFYKKGKRTEFDAIRVFCAGHYRPVLLKLSVYVWQPVKSGNTVVFQDDLSVDVEFEHR